jgi:transcriptional regulator with XRE-family HTH domain
MVVFTLKSPADIREGVRQRLKQRRLALNLTQAGLARRAGVSLGSLKRFETTGRVAFDALLRIALVLDLLGDFDRIGVEDAASLTGRSLDEILAAGRRRNRGRLS